MARLRKLYPVNFVIINGLLATAQQQHAGEIAPAARKQHTPSTSCSMTRSSNVNATLKKVLQAETL